MTTSDAAWWAEFVAGSGVFIGRERELSRLRGALGGTARLLLVVGDAGVGKSRLVAEGLRLAGADGFIAVWGGCLPLTEKLPLLPVADALSELARASNGKLLRAAVDATPPYVRAEVARLLPRLGAGDAAPSDSAEGWRRERLFAALAELLGAVSGRAGLALVVEDVHWADTATLDFLTFLVRAGRGGVVTVLVTCRSDEAPLDPDVAGWLAHVRAAVAVDEIRLSPLSAEETAEQVAALVGGLPSAELARDLFVRGEGNPFFTEQLLLAAAAEQTGPGPDRPRELPARLGDLLAARASRCGDDARAVLAALAVAGRPLTEDVLGAVTRLEPAAVRDGLRDLTATRLLAERTDSGGHRPRHALLAEAVAAGLLPGEQKALHERVARALQAVPGEALAAEVAGHWAAAGRPAEELPARVTAATAAERVFAYAEAAGHWQRAIELSDLTEVGEADGTGVPEMFVRAGRAHVAVGAIGRAAELAEQAYRRFGGHPDPVVAATAHERAAYFRQTASVYYGDPDAASTARPLMEKALAMFERAPPTVDHAAAWFQYAELFLGHGGAGPEACLAAETRALQAAEAAGATTLIPQILSCMAYSTFLCGQIADGRALLNRGREVAAATGDGNDALILAVNGSDCLLHLAEFDDVADLGSRGLQQAREAGLLASYPAAWLAVYTADALVARGGTDQAAALIVPLTTGPPDRDHWFAHPSRALIDLLRGDVTAATERQRQLTATAGQVRSVDLAREAAQRTAEVGLWTGRPGDALADVRWALRLVASPGIAIMYGRLLAAGMRACADLAERARARRDAQAGDAAQDAAAELIAWAEQMGNAPFADHPFVVAIPAERANWEGERSRLAGASDPDAWQAAAKAWADLGCPHRRAYVEWRHAEAELKAGNPRAAATALQAAAAAAAGHAPLLAEVGKLAGRARIPLPGAAPAGELAPAVAPARYGLTGRELAVLRLLASGQTNPQIGAELYMSPKTASVHVSAILRKLGVASRAEAAAVAERAGLLDAGQP